MFLYNCVFWKCHIFIAVDLKIGMLTCLLVVYKYIMPKNHTLSR